MSDRAPRLPRSAISKPIPTKPISPLFFLGHIACLLLGLSGGVLFGYQRWGTSPSPQTVPIEASAPDSSSPPVQVNNPFDVDDKQSYKVLRVLDGDTISIQMGQIEQKVRYMGMNTPELWKDYYGDEAWKENRKWVEGKMVRLEFDPTRRVGSLGRLLAYIHVGDTNVNIELIRTGFAFVTDYIKGTKDIHHYAAMKVAQNEARQAGIGMWDEKAASLWRSQFKRERFYVYSTKVFHRPECRGALTMNNSKKFLFYEEALGKNRQPCRECRPSRGYIPKKDEKDS